ncbi:acyltransferase family protein [Pedobacter yulinensis]|uniref:acyltransferase family protein n=1 Tax=Pedobacter yulinensis TaxID=2126353 RepID=UPI0021D0CDB4|nr:acyltransferase family protein [Pedobacter yulinensis]
MPAWFLAGGQPDTGQFILDYIFRQQWPVGPPWFIWLLLAFNVFALLLPLKLFRRLDAGLQRRPAHTVFLWWLFTLLSLVPLGMWLGRYAWTGFGPFDFQVNRVGFYLIYFLTGAALGGMDWQALVFKDNRLAGLPAGICVALPPVFFTVLEVLTYRGWGAGPDRASAGLLELLLTAICPFSCLVLMWLFRRFAQRPAVLSGSLVANAFGIYLCHYPLLIWLQYALLGVSLPSVVKFFLVSAGSLAGSWVLTALLRRFKPISKIL